MSLISTLRSRRALAGSLALAAGTAAIAAPVVAPPLAAGPLDDDAALAPSGVGDTGTYESCTALFGLTDKSNANYVTFSVSGSASPLPAIDNGLTAVLTVTEAGGTTQECSPQIGFSDQASWNEYLGQAPDVPEIAVILPYGGSPGYLVPNFSVAPVSAGPAALPPTLSLRVTSPDPALTVSSAPTGLVFPPAPDESEMLTLITDELGGPTSPLGARFQVLIGDGPDCDDTLPIDIELGQAFLELTGLPVSLAPTPCSQIGYGVEARFIQLPVQFLGIPVAVTVTAPVPPTPPEPAPEPAAPKFTG